MALTDRGCPIPSIPFRPVPSVLCGVFFFFSLFFSLSLLLEFTEFTVLCTGRCDACCPIPTERMVSESSSAVDVVVALWNYLSRVWDARVHNSSLQLASRCSLITNVRYSSARGVISRGQCRKVQAATKIKRFQLTGAIIREDHSLFSRLYHIYKRRRIY